MSEDETNSTVYKRLLHRREVKCCRCSPNKGCNGRAKKRKGHDKKEKH